MYSARRAQTAVVLMDKIIEIFKANVKTGSQNRLSLIEKFAFISEIVFKAGCAIYYVAGLFYFINPIYAYTTRGEVVPMFPLYFPYVDETTIAGYATLTGIHLVFMVLAATASACSDFLFVLIIVNFPVLSTILCENIDELNVILKEPKVDVILAKAKFRNILMMHREIWE